MLTNRLMLFDILLVSTGIMCSWIIYPLILFDTGSAAQTVNDKVLMLRTLRLLRLIRALRLLVQFKTLWRLVHGLMNSLDILFSTTVLLLLSLYILACVGMELIINDDVLLDNLVIIFAPLVRLRPGLLLYYLSGVLIISIALMNLVTAVLVEQAIQTARMDAESDRTFRQQKMKELSPLIRHLFQTLDQDGSGSITKEEILMRMENHGGRLRVPADLVDIFKPESMLQLFDILDSDDSGECDEDEFVNGVMQMAMTDVPIEARQTLKHIRGFKRKFDKLEHYFQELAAFLMDPPGETSETDETSEMGPARSNGTGCNSEAFRKEPSLPSARHGLESSLRSNKSKSKVIGLGLDSSFKSNKSKSIVIGR